MSISRRFTGGLIRIGLVVLAVVLVVGYFNHGRRHSDFGPRGIHIRRDTPPTDSLGPGDIRIYSADSALDLTLAGTDILTGLSPKTVAKIRSGLDSSAAHESGGFAGNISQIVKQSVAGAIGTHAVFPLSSIRDIRYEGGALVFLWRDGGTHEPFSNMNVDGSKASNAFRADDAERFIAAVHARQRERDGSRRDTAR